MKTASNPIPKPPHVPVLLDSVLEAVRSMRRHDGWLIDATFGRGGHSIEILKQHHDIKILAIDCDAEAIEFAQTQFHDFIQSGRLRLIRDNFVNLKKVYSDFGPGEGEIVGILMDLGVSSPQLDQGHRGFSFYHDGPLDMRLDQSLPITAADLVNTWDADSLNKLFRTYGEVRRPERVTERIVEQRKTSPFTRTLDLSHLIEKTDGWRIKGHHPATQYFMALRLEVNQELSVIERVLPDAVEILASNGRLFVITFHSLEDRIVKTALKKMSEEGLGLLVNKKVIQAEWSEAKKNPRARSAKLRVFEKK